MERPKAWMGDDNFHVYFASEAEKYFDHLKARILELEKERDEARTTIESMINRTKGTNLAHDILQDKLNKTEQAYAELEKLARDVVKNWNADDDGYVDHDVYIEALAAHLGKGE